MGSKSFCYLSGFILTIATCCSASTKTYYTAAIFEHARQGDGSSTGVKTNLEFYRRATEEASKQGAELIVFPEYGIFPPGKRHEVKEYLERIPNPKEVSAIPCSGTYRPDSPILYSLSCMAKNNNIIVVANIGGIEKCHRISTYEDYDCPRDGDLHFNANVAFDQNGRLVGRYYKEHLYFEEGMDLPREKQDPTFKTDIGMFAMFICFDIIFKRIVDVSQQNDITAILFPTMWVNSSPFYSSVQWFQAWAMGNNSTLLASNLNMPGDSAVGSGIFKGREGSVVSTFNPDGISKLIVATIPKLNHAISSTSKIFAITKNTIKPYVDEVLPVICSYNILEKPFDLTADYSCLNDNVGNYTLIKLNTTKDHLKVCSNGLCCELEYDANDMNENFYFGVYNGTYNSFNRYFWSEEKCFLTRCEEFNGTVCANFLMKSKTVFNKIYMRANFTTKYIYPSLVGSDMRLVPVKQWSFGYKRKKHLIEFSRNPGTTVLIATLMGRAYNRDPPYKR